MAISTGLGLALGGLGALGGAAVSSSATKRAANAATDAANQSAAVQREQLTAAKNALSPYQNLGVPAGQTLNALLGLGGSAGTAGGLDYAGYVSANPDLQAEFSRVGDQFGGDQAAFGQYHYNTFGQGEGRQLPTAAGTAGTNATTAARNAFDVFKQSIGYQDTLNSAMDAVNSGYAGAGTIKSGAAIKAAQDRAAEIAQGTLGQYMNALGNQQGLGMSAGSALAGVGQNYANSMMFNNNTRADAIGNAALLNAKNTNNMLSGLTAGIFKYGVG